MVSDWRKVEKVPRSLVFRATSLICLLLISLLYTVDLSSDVVPSDQWKIRFSIRKVGQGIEDLLRGFLFFLISASSLFSINASEDQTQLERTGFACHTDLQTQVCVANRPVRIDMSTMNIYAPFSQYKPQANHTIRPYARQEDKAAMSLVSPVQILQGNTPPACQYTHNVPAVVFSSGGFSGNLFHEFSEILIPLFITCHHFQSRLHFIVTDFSPSFVGKFKNILSHLSGYEVINPTANGSVHCFPGAVVGLHYHDNLAIIPSDIPKGYSMLDFKQFLRKSYNLKTRDLSQTEQPVLILISRQSSRMFLNENEMVTMMKVLGFKVVIARPNEMSNLEKFSQVVNTCSVMVGAHGAGLTNAIFLPQGAVLVQLVPLGLDWASTNYFGGPATDMGLNYIEYKIEPEESSLMSLYGGNHPVITNPASIFAKGYTFARAVYIDKQNMYVNVVRFRKTLIKALGLLGRSAPSGQRNRALR